jgi:hypothetical protein
MRTLEWLGLLALGCASRSAWMTDETGRISSVMDEPQTLHKESEVPSAVVMGNAPALAYEARPPERYKIKPPSESRRARLRFKRLQRPKVGQAP